MISASDIRERKFEKAAFGYKQEEIDDFLAELISEFEELDAEREDRYSLTFTVRFRYLPIR